MSYGQSDFENNHLPARSSSPQRINNANINNESPQRPSSRNFDNSDNVFNEPDSVEFRFAPRNRCIDDNSMEQAHDRYLGNQFYIDDGHQMNPNMYSDDNINLFDLSPDQQLAIRELELRRQQADFEDDYDYAINYDQILDYDVREKLESLNAQLANEPSPPEPEHRNSKVAFKEELISLVAPAEEYELSESDQEEPPDVPTEPDINPLEITNGPNYTSPAVPPEGNSITESIAKSNDVDSLPDTSLREQSRFRNKDNVENEKVITKEKFVELEDDDDHNILVSRGGEFQLMGQSDMIDSSDRRLNDRDDLIDKNYSKNKPRPISAPSSKRNRNETWSNSQLDSSNSSVRSDTNYRSKSIERNKSNLDVPRVDRDLLQRQKEREENRKREQLEREKLESESKREMNEKCFNAWLQSKIKTSKDELERKKKEEEEEKQQREKIKEERRTNAMEKEKELSKIWEKNKRREEKLRQYRLKEMKESVVVHTDVECQKAFREWMKKKKQNHQMKQKEEKQKARITRLAMRQCRKSQNLAQAIHQANTFRYLDFYGYPR